MSENKFIKHLKGKQTAKSLVEIDNQSAKTSFGKMPAGTSDSTVQYSDHRGNVTIVANGTTNWKIDGSNLVLANNVYGDGQDFLSTASVSGTGLWINSSYTFPSTGDPRHPIAMVFNPSTKWVLKVCGDNLIVDGGSTIDFTMLVKIGTANVYSKNFTVRESAGQFSKEFVIDFGEANLDIVKAGGLSTLTVQLLCGTANASARIYNGMSVLTCLQRKVDASAVSNNGGNVEDVLNGNMIPVDYFSNPAFIDQIEDGDEAYAVFTRDGDNVDLSGWTPKNAVAYKDEVIIKTDDMPTASADLLGAIYQYVGETTAPYQHGYIYECVEISAGVYGWERIDVQPGGSRGRFLSLWNCVTGLPESTPSISPFEYKSGDYYIVSVVSTATPPVNYKPDGSSYTTGVPSTTLETGEVAVDDTYFYDGTTWKLQSNSNKTVTFSNIAGDIYDNASATTALNAKQNTLVSGINIKTINSNSVLGSGNLIIDGLPTQTGNSGKLVTTNGTTASWTELKTLNSSSIIGSGNIDVLVNEATATNALGVGYTTINTTYNDSINIGNAAQVLANNAIALGAFASAEGQDSIAIYSSTGTAHRARTTHTGNIAIGYNALAINAAYTIAIGYNAFAQGLNSIQLGTGNVASQNTFQVWTHKLLDKTTGLIPAARFADQTSATQGQVLTLDANLDAVWTTISTMTGASAGDAGTSGLVPAPAAGDQAKFLQGDGTWANPTAATAWGNITGTLSSQTDLQSALNTKQGLLGGGTSGTLLTNSGTPGTVSATSIDATPTDGSNNPVSSDGVYDALAGKVNTGHELIAYQAPTSGNNYTWYRKYADGWVIQGGRQTGSVSVPSGGQGQFAAITLPVPMADERYVRLAMGDGYTMVMTYDASSTTFRPIFGAYGQARTLTRVYWLVAGKAA